MHFPGEMLNLLGRQTLHVTQRFYSGSRPASGMASLWERIKTGVGKSVGEGEKIKEQAFSKPVVSKTTSRTSSIPHQSTLAPQVSSPWDVMEQARKQVQAQDLPSTTIWMHSPFFRGSTQKLNLLARQISNLNIDAAIIQMQFSPKKFSKPVIDVLIKLKETIIRQRGLPAEYYVKEAMVGRGTYMKRLDIKGRGRCGTLWKGHAFIRICANRPDPEALVRKLLRIKKIPREDKPVLRRLDYY